MSLRLSVRDAASRLSNSHPLASHHPNTMKRFAELVSELDQTNSTTAKVEAMYRYLDQAPDRDKIWMMALFSHRRPRRGVKTTLLREWAAAASGIPLWLVEESYHVVGDLAETLALILPPPVREASDTGLSEWMNFLEEMGQAEESTKRSMLEHAWEQLDRQALFVFHKLITGGFRLGVSQKLLVKALAKHSALAENVVAHRLMGSWLPGDTEFQELLFSEDGADDLSKPYPFFLAHPIDGSPESLGEVEAWQAEWKWDGIRSQAIKRGGKAFLWSRGEELITEKFPELAPLFARLPDGTVIDGELLPFRDGKPLSFQLLQTRIGRKNVTRKELKESPCLIIAYDLLEWKGKDLRPAPLEQRRQLLEQLVQDCNLPTGLQISALVPAQSWGDLTEAREQSRALMAEGLMLKRKSSAYQVGRKRGDWWKWKVDPLTVDAVMIYAQRGHGRRANLFSDYTFAVWDEDRLVPFAKAYSGLTDAEMLQVDTWIKANTLERFGPVRSVKAELVFEIGFEGINRSTRHKSGIALRFPRMLRWRQDKRPAEADSLAFLQGLLAEDQTDDAP